MTLYDFLSPKRFWKTLRSVSNNVENWNYYRQTMQSLRDTGTLSQAGMRLDMRNRAYYIINLEPETLMLGSDVLELERSRVLESIAVRKPIFENVNLGEIIEARTERIKTGEYYAYLIQIKYRPTVSIGNWVYLIMWLATYSSLALFGFSNMEYLVNILDRIQLGITGLIQKH